MLPATLIAFLVAVSASAWIYSKMLRRTGGNNQSSLVVAGLAGVMAFIITLTLLSLLDNYLG